MEKTPLKEFVLNFGEAFEKDGGSVDAGYAYFDFVEKTKTRYNNEEMYLFSFMYSLMEKGCEKGYSVKELEKEVVRVSRDPNGWDSDIFKTPVCIAGMRAFEKKYKARQRKSFFQRIKNLF